MVAGGPHNCFLFQHRLVDLGINYIHLNEKTLQADVALEILVLLRWLNFETIIVIISLEYSRNEESSPKFTL